MRLVTRDMIVESAAIRRPAVYTWPRTRECVRTHVQLQIVIEEAARKDLRMLDVDAYPRYWYWTHDNPD